MGELTLQTPEVYGRHALIESDHHTPIPRPDVRGRHRMQQPARVFDPMHVIRPLLAGVLAISYAADESGQPDVGKFIPSETQDAPRETRSPAEPVPMPKEEPDGSLEGLLKQTNKFSADQG